MNTCLYIRDHTQAHTHAHAHAHTRAFTKIRAHARKRTDATPLRTNTPIHTTIHQRTHNTAGTYAHSRSIKMEGTRPHARTCARAHRRTDAHTRTDEHIPHIPHAHTYTCTLAHTRAQATPPRAPRHAIRDQTKIGNATPPFFKSRLCLDLPPKSPAGTNATSEPIVPRVDAEFPHPSQRHLRAACVQTSW